MSGAPPGRVPGRGVALLERRETLGADLTSAAAARRLLRDALHELQRDAWLDVGELVLSEVVTNATLHAHTPIELHLEVFDDEVCVEVRDYNPTLPLRRDYDDEATTGRGMGMVSALARACGVHSLGDGGKIVWFCVGDDTAADVDGDALLAAWDIDEAEEPSHSTVHPCDVVLPSLPATLWLSARQHHDAILRELVLYAATHDGVDPDFARADDARSTISNALVAALDEAHALGTAEPALPDGHPSPLPWVPRHLDLRLSVAPDAAPAFAALQDVLDLAEELAVAGELLIPPGLPEIVAVRDWACEQVIAQLSGMPPAPWAGTAQERFETTVHDRGVAHAPAWDASVVVGAVTGAIAADEANRIVAVSRPLADLLGWGADELVGRRVVTVVPPALREAHVAGFSRHLSTGEAHVLGVPLELPVLRRDGGEVRCRFLIERARVSGTGAIYVAWIDPVPDGS